MTDAHILAAIQQTSGSEPGLIWKGLARNLDSNPGSLLVEVSRFGGGLLSLSTV